MPYHPNEIPDSFDIIENHLSEYFDDSEILVFHEEKSEFVHSDVYLIKPNEERDYYIVMSSGMSALAMKVPENSSHLQYAEILILLPPDWKIDFTIENNYWPIRLIWQLSKFPHLNNTWLGWGHTLPLDPRHPANHGFSSVIILDVVTLPSHFTIIAGEDKVVNVYAVIPLYKEELDFKLKEGVDKLLEKFEIFNVNDILNIYRANTCLNN